MRKVLQTSDTSVFAHASACLKLLMHLGTSIQTQDGTDCQGGTVLCMLRGLYYNVKFSNRHEIVMMLRLNNEHNSMVNSIEI